MLDTSDWPEKKLHVLRDLHLDPKNVRLEIADAKVEADILEDLFVNENALGLVEGICTVGYLTHDVPVAIKRDGRYVMVEGNRRLAALKAIQNPQLVPDYRARIAGLADQLPNRSALARIRVMVAPNQDEADELIAATHTGVNLRKAWSPARQAAFFQAQIDNGRKLPDLVARYPTIEVRKFVFRAHILNEFRAVKYGESALRDYLKTKAWKRGLSALARIYESKEFLEITGFQMDTKGNVSKSISKKTFKEIATVIVRGMLDGDLTTRSLNTVKSPRFLQLMGELRAIVSEGKPAEKTSGKSASADTKTQQDDAAGNSARNAQSDEKRSGAHKDNAETGKTKSTAPRTKRKRYLDLGQITVPEAYPRAVGLCVEELSAVEVQRFPNAAFLLMRAVLEKSVKAFAEAKNEDIRGSGNNEKGRVYLSHALKWLLGYATANGSKSMIQPIEQVRTGRLVTYTNSSDALNALNHNHHFSVNPDEAVGMWGSIDPILRYVMRP
ncbi:MAG TPA: hypothetical protein VI039_00385 [Solirubrobacterales bacterium]